MHSRNRLGPSRSWTAAAILFAACSGAPPPAPRSVQAAGSDVPAPSRAGPAQFRATGAVQALKALSIRVPSIAAQRSQLTLTELAPNGARVEKGMPIIEFDSTTMLDEAREAQAKLEELTHQKEERVAKARSDSAKRLSLIREAEAELAKARIQLKKGPVLADIVKRQNEIKAATAEASVAVLERAHAAHEKEEAAAVRILDLKIERQNVGIERIKSNLAKLSIAAPQDGMVALENTWRAGTMGPPQEGDQMYPGQPVLRIFDPSSMVVDVMVNEPDVAALTKGAVAKVYLDAYPDAAFTARLEAASPVATAALNTPVRAFAARFRVDQQDPRLLPDLSASLEIAPAPPGAAQ
ncbi:MAG: efflux RND transporter periplasmic adaptor subunit [Bryobacteraceae bacterium]